MRRRLTSLIDRLFASSDGCDQATLTQTARWLWAGWSINVLLGLAAPWRRALLGMLGSGSLPILAGVALMPAILIATRARPRVLLSALLMSAAGLTVGSSLAFLSFWCLTHKVRYGLLAIKWIVLSTALTLAFAHNVASAARRNESEDESPDFESMSPDEIADYAQGLTEQIEAQLKALESSVRLRLWGSGLIFLGGLLILLSTSSHEDASAYRSLALAVLGVLLLVGAAGVAVRARRASP